MDPPEASATFLGGVGFPSGSCFAGPWRDDSMTQDAEVTERDMAVVKGLAEGLKSEEASRLTAAWVVGAKYDGLPELTDVSFAYGSIAVSPTVERLLAEAKEGPGGRGSDAGARKAGEVLQRFTTSEVTAMAKFLLIPGLFPGGWPDVQEWLVEIEKALGGKQGPLHH